MVYASIPSHTASTGWEERVVRMLSPEVGAKKVSARLPQVLANRAFLARPMVKRRMP